MTEMYNRKIGEYVSNVLSKSYEKDKKVELITRFIINNHNLQDIYGTWIPCSDRLPIEKIDPLTRDFAEYLCTYKKGDVYRTRCYKYGNRHWWNGPEVYDEHIIAWMPLLTPYMGR